MSNHRPASFRHASFRGQIGLARVDITPEVGIYCRNWGAAVHDVAESIHRPLTLTALTLTASQGGPTLVFVDADLGWWKTPQTYRRFIDRLCATLQIDPEHLIFALSHTHSGPPLMEADDTLPGSEKLRDWQEKLFQQTVRAIRESIDNQFDGTLDWHTGRCNLATNRDLPDPDPEQSRVVCGFNPDQKADDTLLVGRVTDQAGEVRATLTNYACHPTTLAWDNRAISPDYIGAMRETIEQATGGLSLFMLGACGELAPRTQYVSDPNIADAHGRALAHACLATLYGMEPAATELSYAQTVESGATLATWQRDSYAPSTTLRPLQATVELPIKNWPSADSLEAERLACQDRALAERLLRKRDIRRFLGDANSYELQISAWRIGDAVLIGCCCEPYSMLQTELRRHFKNHSVVCMNLINGSLGYLPPAERYDSDIYPVWQTPFERGSLEKTLQAMTQAIHDVFSE
ncbi:MAG: alkaline ceramidase [Rubripirellula sp.]